MYPRKSHRVNIYVLILNLILFRKFILFYFFYFKESNEVVRYFPQYFFYVVPHSNFFLTGNRTNFIPHLCVALKIIAVIYTTCFDELK